MATWPPALGIEHMAAHGVQGRGVLINLYSHLGMLAMKLQDLTQGYESDQIVVETGDILCFWTGLDSLIMWRRPTKTIN